MNIKNIKHKLHKLSYLLVTLPLAGGVMSGTLTSCSDWNDHYEDGNGSAGSNTTLWEEIKNNPQLSDFAEVLEAIKVTRQHKKTTTSYAENLMGGHALTIFAPVNGTFDKEELIRKAQEGNSGDSAVEKSFAMNHLINSPHSVGGTEDGKKLLLLNNKYAVISNNSVNDIAISEKNLRCKNGIMHILEKPLPYEYDIYEALTNLPEFKEGAGKVLKKYNLQEFDPVASTENGTFEGMTVYADSVTKEVNKMVDALKARLKDVDSTYTVAVPSLAGWNRAYEKALKAYNYPSALDKRDSIQEYHTYRALMDDAFFSMTTLNGKQQDSLVSVRFNSSDPRLHNFKNPTKEGGILYGAEDKVKCVNGTIYQMPEWSFKPSETYHHFIEVEGESYKDARLNKVPKKYSSKSEDPIYGDPTPASGDSISKGKFIILRGTGEKNWATTFRIEGTLSAKYDIKIKLLPFSVYPTSEEVLPCRFRTYLNYKDDNGKDVYVKCDAKSYVNDPYKTSVITIYKGFEFPLCNYGRTNDDISLTIETYSDFIDYTTTMYLDAIILEPSEEE